MSLWLSLMKMPDITLIPEECDPEEVQKIADVGWFSILVAGKVYEEFGDLLWQSPDNFRAHLEENIHQYYMDVGLSDRLEWDFAVRLTWICYQAKVVPPVRMGLPSVQGNCWCGSPAEHVDHLWPLSHGGPRHPTRSGEGGQADHRWNFMDTCAFHNGQKYATPMLIYRPGFLDHLRTYAFLVTW